MKWHLRHTPPGASSNLGYFEGPVPRPGEKVFYTMTNGLRRSAVVETVEHELTEDGKAIPQVYIHSPNTIKRLMAREAEALLKMGKEGTTPLPKSVVDKCEAAIKEAEDLGADW